MLYEKVLENAMYVSEMSIVDYLFDNGVNVEFSSTLNVEACLFIKDEKANITLRNNLSVERTKFAILHEIGHYALDVENGVYSLSLELNKSKSEFKANLFACFCLLKNVDLMDLNIIQYLISKGCSQGIAVKVFEYMQHNMKDMFIAY